MRDGGIRCAMAVLDVCRGAWATEEGVCSATACSGSHGVDPCSTDGGAFRGCLLLSTATERNGGEVLDGGA
jgi:hypothetical protein